MKHDSHVQNWPFFCPTTYFQCMRPIRSGLKQEAVTSSQRSVTSTKKACCRSECLLLASVIWKLHMVVLEIYWYCVYMKYFWINECYNYEKSQHSGALKTTLLAFLNFEILQRSDFGNVWRTDAEDFLQTSVQMLVNSNDYYIRIVIVVTCWRWRFWDNLQSLILQ